MPKLVVSYTPASERNDFDGGWVGMRFSPTVDLNVTKLGAMRATGGTGNHTVRLYEYVPVTSPMLRTTTVDFTGGTTGTIYYSSITPITLTAGVDYAILAQIVLTGGQYWHELTPVTVQDANDVNAIYSTDGVSLVDSGPDYFYHGVDLEYDDDAGSDAAGTASGVGTATATGADANLVYLRPDSDIALDGWTGHAGGTTNIYQTLDETSASDSDFVQSPSVAGGGGGDTDFSNVVMLLGFDGTDAATTTPDLSSVARTMTFVADAQIDTAQKKFGTASCMFDGTGDAVTTPFTSDFVFAGAFTIEGWMYFPSGLADGQYGLISSYQTGSRSFRLYWVKDNATPARYINAQTSSGGSTATHNVSSGNVFSSLTDDAWHHVAWDRDSSSKMRLFLNGVMIASTSGASTTNFSTTAPVTIGGVAGAGIDYNGWLDEWRVTNGTSRYGDVSGDASFTPPSVAFPRVSGTVDLKVRLFDGATQVAEWTHTGVTETFATAEQTLTAPQVAAIADFTNLFVEFDDNQGNVYRFALSDPPGGLASPAQVKYRYKKLTA